MKITNIVFLLTLLNCSLAFATVPFRMSLINDKVGVLPTGWIEAKTGEGAGSVWKVVEDKTREDGKAIAQTSSEGANRIFNLCVAQDTNYSGVDIELAIMAMSGEMDQGGGPVWRYTDANNYYVARVNPLEDNYRVYKVVEGKRIELGSMDVDVLAGKWHRLRVVHQGDHIQCFLNDQLRLDVHDGTFAQAGKIGLWTKADAVTYFSNLEAKQPAGEIKAGEVIVVRIPADYFLHHRSFFNLGLTAHPVLRGLVMVLKNFIGIVFLLLGVAMLVLPGQGIITILIGLIFIDFPGKFALERRIIKIRSVHRAINWMRTRARKSPLILPRE
jgi:hypothetical protein